MKTEIIIEIINGYKEAFIFAEPATDHNGEYIENLGDYDFSDQAHQRIIHDVAAYCDANDAAISEAMSDGATANQIGNDLHFTRNGHGVGFWDRPEIYTPNTANRLTSAAEVMPDVSAYIGEDNLIYIE
ncbi:hypothetical protein [Escherichia phage pEC-M2929-1AR.1]|nr:hypothetical protein [Escherichia phage pEC-M2929-1AR.1]